MRCLRCSVAPAQRHTCRTAYTRSRTSAAANDGQHLSWAVWSNLISVTKTQPKCTSTMPNISNISPTKTSVSTAVGHIDSPTHLSCSNHPAQLDIQISLAMWSIRVQQTNQTNQTDRRQTVLHQCFKPGRALGPLPRPALIAQVAAVNTGAASSKSNNESSSQKETETASRSRAGAEQSAV